MLRRINRLVSPVAADHHLKAGQAPRSRGLILLTLWLLVFVLSSQFLMIAPVLPDIAERFAVPEEHLGLAMGIYGFFLAPVALLSGPVSDRFGRRRMILTGSLAMAITLLLHGVVGSFGALLVARGLSGAAGGVLAGSAVAYIGDCFPPGERGTATGWVMSGIAAGQILGVPAGTLLSGRLGFAAPFVILGVVMAVSFLLALVKLPQPALLERADLSLRAAIRIYLRLLSRMPTFVGIALYPLVFIAFTCYSLYLPVWLAQGHGSGNNLIALVFLAGGLGNLVASPIGGNLSDHIGRRSTILATTLALAVILPALPWAGSIPAAVVALFLLINALGGARSSAIQAQMTDLVPMKWRGSFLSLAMAVGQLGVAIGSVVAGLLYDLGGFTLSCWVAALITLSIAALAAAGLPAGRPDAVPAP